MSGVSERFLTPKRSTDVFVTLGSGNKVHVVAKADVQPANAKFWKTTVRCGRKGKARITGTWTTPPNLEERNRVCGECREFAKESAG